MPAITITNRANTPAIYRPNNRAYTPTINRPTGRQALCLTTITTTAGTVLLPGQTAAMLAVNSDLTVATLPVAKLIPYCLPVALQLTSTALPVVIQSTTTTPPIVLPRTRTAFHL